jgi:hypothetical protein
VLQSTELTVLIRISLLVDRKRKKLTKTLFEPGQQTSLAIVEQSKGQKIIFFRAPVEKPGGEGRGPGETSRGIGQARVRAPFRGLRLGRQIEAREGKPRGWEQEARPSPAGEMQLPESSECDGCWAVSVGRQTVTLKWAKCPVLLV